MLRVFEEERVVIAKYIGPVRGGSCSLSQFCCQKLPAPAARSAGIASPTSPVKVAPAYGFLQNASKPWHCSELQLASGRRQRISFLSKST